MNTSQEHHRRSIRLHGWDYSQPGAYFITMVTQGHVCTFGEVLDEEMRLSDEGRVAEECWRAIPDNFPNVELGAYVVMPNHVHGIIILHEHERNGDRSETDINRSAIKSPTVRATHPQDTLRYWVAPTNESNESQRDGVRNASEWVAPTDGSQRVAVSNGPKRGSIGAIIGAYKMSVTRKIVQHGGAPHFWQRNYYEHIIRDDAEHNRIRLYIESNPVNWVRDEENPERQR